jgi:quinol monooxygenase YgiN
MYIVHVFIHVKPEFVDDFITATTTNARQSVQEPGIARFDFIQKIDDPNRFVLVEVYRTPDDPAKHKGTAHYQSWKAAVEDMMAEPRESTKFVNIFPDEEGW